MLSPTIEEHNIKQAMVNELNFLSKEANKAGTKSIGGVESIKDFFENYSTLPIKVIFTTQTRDEVINYLYGLDKNIDVITIKLLETEKVEEIQKNKKLLDMNRKF